MRVLLMRCLVGVTLACWVLSAFFSQLVWLHVETEHRGHRHAEEHGPALLVPHADNHGDHEHQFTSARGPGLPSPRAQAPAPVLAYLPIEWTSPAILRIYDSAPIPRPRGSPQLHTILLI